jgi:hypothetical protein
VLPSLVCLQSLNELHDLPKTNLTTVPQLAFCIANVTTAFPRPSNTGQ